MDRTGAIRVLEEITAWKYCDAESAAAKVAIAALREQEQREQDVPDTNIGKWISVEERLPDAAQGMEGVLGFVNGYNGRITFTDAYLFVKYDYAENVWWSEDYDIEGCKVTHWMPLPEPPEVEA